MTAEAKRLAEAKALHDQDAQRYFSGVATRGPMGTPATGPSLRS